MCAHKGQHGDLTQKEHLASWALCSAAGSLCFINSTVNAEVSSGPSLCGDAG